ncbi:hypothetical protein D1872_202880 [compost metagenome]
MEINPCSAGHLVLAAAAAIGALPNPASLAKIPLATPLRIASIIVAPANPPVADVVENAEWSTSAIAAGSWSANRISTMRQISTYKPVLKGTTFVDTLAMLLSPPIVTSPVRIAIISAVTMGGTPKLFSVEDTIALTCGNVPIPNNATSMPEKANSIASGLKRRPRPFSI